MPRPFDALPRLYSQLKTSLFLSAETYSVLVVLIVLWVGNFLHFSDFGFYEDDWYNYPMDYGVPLLATLRVHWATLFIFGRPLQAIIPKMVTSAGVIAGSIPVFYFVIFLFSAAKSVLAYFVLRLRFSRTPSTVATVLFVISPLTTVRESLDIESFVAPAFCFAFAAILLYVRKRFVFAYLMAACALLTYEPMFFLFLAAPLFSERDGIFNRARVTELARHVVVCAAVFAAVFLERRYTGESRVASVTGGPGIIWRIISFDLFYSVSSVRAYFYAIWITLKNLSTESVFYSLVFLVAGSIGIRRSGVANKPDRGPSPEWREAKAGMGLGAILIVLAFSLAVFHLGGARQWQVAGRDTRIASAAAFGSSLFFVSFFLFLTEVVSTRFLKRAVAGTFIVLLSVLFSYSIFVQQDYVAVWRHHVGLLRQAIMLTPDAGADSTIMVRTEPRWQVPFPKDESERMPSVGHQKHGLQLGFLGLTHSTTAPKLVFLETSEWSKYLKFEADGLLHWTGQVAANGTEPLVPGRVISLSESGDGALIRADRQVTVAGKPILQMLDRQPDVSNWDKLLEAPLAKQILGAMASRGLVVNGKADQVASGACESPVLDPKFPSGTILLEAEKFARGNAVVDTTAFGAGIGVVVTPPSVLPAFVEYDITIPAAADYDLYVRYATVEPRPLTASINGRVVSDAVCSAPTGGYDPSKQLWQGAGKFRFEAGVNHLRLSADHPFPAVDKIALKPPSELAK